MSSSQLDTIVYLAQGKIRLKRGEAPARTVDSVYGNSIREKAIRSAQRHSWKGQGDGSPFAAAAWGNKGMQTGEVPIHITSLCASKEPGNLLYSLESESLCALVEVRELGADEQRLWNDNNTKLRHVSVSKTTGDMVFSVLHQNGTANIGVKRAGRGGFMELTEGDSFDTAPRWKGDERFIIYQSAGVGRNREGHFLMFGPFSIQELDTEAGEITTLVEAPGTDCLAPHSAADGNLYYIQRPYTGQDLPGFWSSIKNLLLFPFRLAHAIYNFLNFFSAIFSGKKLASNTQARSREMDMKQMMIWGNLVRSQRPEQVEDESADLVPKSWQLMQRSPNGQTKSLASGVLAYDVGPDGDVVYTNGNAVFHLRPDGTKRHIINERMIEQVFWVDTRASGLVESNRVSANN